MRSYLRSSIALLDATAEVRPTARDRSGGRQHLGALDAPARAARGRRGDGVLVDTYSATKDAPVRVDLDALWRKLGVALEAGCIRPDDAAPLAGLRCAIVAGPR
jgi:hypothetical protein